MKLTLLKRKRVWIPSSLVGLLGLLLAWGAIERNQMVADCNKGIFETCRRILDNTEFDSDKPIIDLTLITTEQGKAQLAKAQAQVDAERAEEAAKAEAEAIASAKNQAAEVARRRAIARANGHDVNLANFNSLGEE